MLQKPGNVLFKVVHRRLNATVQIMNGVVKLKNYLTCVLFYKIFATIDIQ